MPKQILKSTSFISRSTAPRDAADLLECAEAQVEGQAAHVVTGGAAPHVARQLLHRAHVLLHRCSRAHHQLQLLRATRNKVTEANLCDSTIAAVKATLRHRALLIYKK